MQLFCFKISVLRYHQGRYSQAVAIDINNVAIQAKVNAVIQAIPIPSERSYLPAFLSGLPNLLGAVDEIRFSISEDISITFPI